MIDDTILGKQTLVKDFISICKVMFSIYKHLFWQLYLIFWCGYQYRKASEDWAFNQIVQMSINVVFFHLWQGLLPFKLLMLGAIAFEFWLCWNMILKMCQLS